MKKIDKETWMLIAWILMVGIFISIAISCSPVKYDCQVRKCPIVGKKMEIEKRDTLYRLTIKYNKKRWESYVREDYFLSVSKGDTIRCFVCIKQ